MKKIIRILGFIGIAVILVYLYVEPFYTPTAIINTNQAFSFPRLTAHKSLVSKNFVGNSLPALQEALDTAVDGIEVDIRLTKDRIPVLFHAENLEELTNGKGRIEDKTQEELKSVLYKDGQSKIVSLDEVFELVGSSKKLFLDIKERGWLDSGLAKIIADRIDEYQLYESVIVESFNPFFLTYMRLENRAVMLMYDFTDDGKAQGEEVQAQFDQIPWILKQDWFRRQVRRIVRPDILGPRWSVDSDLLKFLSQQGYPIIAWTVDDPAVAGQLFTLGVSGLQSNDPIQLMKSLDQGVSSRVTDAGGTETDVAQRFYITKQEDVLKALEFAKKEKRKVSIAGRRHTMGGQTSASDSVNLDMLGYNKVEYDEKTERVKVQSGATWKKIQAILNRRGRAVQVMQSDNIFSLGGSIGVNVHGWQVGRPPLGASIYQMQVMTASGEVKTVSPTKNPDLFKAVVGGYGLFGVILEVELNTVADSDLKMQSIVVIPSQFEESFRQKVSENPNVELAYGRLSVAKSHLFDEVGIFWFEKVSGSSHGILEGEKLIAFKRAIFRMSEMSDKGKSLRWSAEKAFAKMNEGSIQTRNSIMSPDIHVLWPIKKGHRDVLHEYFIPKGQVDAFIGKMRELVLKDDMNLLNVTIREVRKDESSLLPYARTDSFAFVLLFSQNTDEAGENNMKAFTEKSVDAALSVGGTFYLPYKLHYSKDQLLKAYPMLPQWLQAKKKIDPSDLFTSRFWEYIK